MSMFARLPLWMLKLRQRLSTFQAELWMPAVAVFCCGLVVSGLVARDFSHSLRDMVQERLVRQADLFTTALEQRISAHSDIVHSVQTVFSIFSVDSEVRRDGFADTLSQNLYERRPGTWSLSFTHLVPAADYIAYRERLLDEASVRQWDAEDMLPRIPLEERNYIVNYIWFTRGIPPRVTLNIEPSHEFTELLGRVERTRQLQMSEPMVLGQEGNDDVVGVAISAPVANTRVEGNPVFVGSTNLGVSLKSIVHALRSKGMLERTVVSIRDIGVWPVPDDVEDHHPVRAVPHLYQSEDWEALRKQTDAMPLRQELHLMGRRWELTFLPTPDMLTAAEAASPWLVGAGGVLVSVLLAIIVWLFARQRIRAQLQAQARQNMLQNRADRFQVLFNQSAVGVLEFDPVSGRCKQANQRLCDMLGYTVEEMRHLSLYNLIAPSCLPQCRKLVDDLVLGRITRYTLEHAMHTRTGEVVWVEQWTSPLVGSDGKPGGTYIAMLQNVTVRRQMQQQLEESEAFSRDMLAHVPVGLVVTSAGGKVEYINDKFSGLSGLSLAQLGTEDELWQTLLSGGAPSASSASGSSAGGGHRPVPTQGVRQATVELTIKTARGQELPVDVGCNAMSGGRVLLSFVDLSQRKQAEEKIRWLAFYDTLTHLPNRRMLLDRLETVLSGIQAHRTRGALLLLDLDNFKTLNETLGHEHGDVLLRLVAARLANNVPRNYTLARLGGDEFALLFDELQGDTSEEATASAEGIVQVLLDALQEPFFINGQVQHVTTCMGVAVFGPEESLTVEELLKRANLALHQSKGMGRGTLQFFHFGMQEAITARAQMEKDLRLALERKEFTLYYQPQVQGGEVVGAEALLRWKHPEKGFVSPALFVPIAEETNIILALGERVLVTACKQLAQWANVPELSELSVAVNVSPRQFFQPDFVHLVRQTLESTGARADLLELELTEGMLLADVDDTIQKMRQLKELGISFALDDFGTGYSSLNYLKRLPLDKLKIDQSFVREVLVNGNDASIACTIVALGHSLGLRVIAEGVETAEQRDFLNNNGCTIWQGYLFSRPLPGEDFAKWVHDFSNPHALGE